MNGTNLRRFLHLLAYARPYTRQALVQVGLMAASTAFVVLKPWPLKVLVDHAVGERPFTLWGMQPNLGVETLIALACLAYLLIHAGESLTQLASTAVATLTSSRMIRDLRADLFGRLQLLSLRFHDDHRVGDLVHRIAYNTGAVETAFQSGFMGVIKSAVTLAAMFCVMLALNPLLTAVALAVAPLLALAIRWYAKHIQQLAWKHQEQEGAVASQAQEDLGAIRLIKAFNHEQRRREDFTQLASRSVETRLRSTMVQGMFGLVTAVILALGVALLFWIGVGQVRAGKLTLGEFLVFHAYLAMLYAPLSVLSYTASSVQSALGGGARLFEILETEPEIRDAPDAVALERVQGALALRDVVFGYEADKPVLRGVSLDIRPGEVVAVVGETGGGKSTLLNLLLRFYDPWSGAVLLDGRDLRTITYDSLRKHLALAPQEALLLSGSIEENIAYGKPDATPDEIARAARLAAADDFIAALPDGYHTRVGERGVRLSAGQRQRIALARALLKDAPILLLDEPTSALDAETEARVLSGLTDYAKQRTVVIVAHRLSTVRHADRIVVIAHGAIAEEGTHDQLLNHCGAYARLWEAQAAAMARQERW